MSSLREKLEKVHSLLINEENEKAEALFHEAFVEAAREIHKQIMEEEDWQDEGDDELMVDEAADEDAETDEVDAEETDDEYVSDEDMEDEAEEDLESDMDDEEGEEEGDVEDRIADLEAELEALKSEFETLQDIEDEEHGDDYGPEEYGDEQPDEDGDMDMEEGMYEDELSTMGDGPSHAGHHDGGKTPADKRKHPDHGGRGPSQGDDNIRDGHGDWDGVYEEDEVDALDESFELESVSNENKESGIGSGNSFDPSLNKHSPIPQKSGAARHGGDAVDWTKGKNHKGFDREDAPATQHIEKRKNVRYRSEEDMSKMSKEGDASAAINKTESEFGKGNMKSPIGSKGTTQTKGLTESRKRKS